METTPTNRSLFRRFFDRPHFQTLEGWRIDYLICFIFAVVVTPADPYSVFFVAIPLFVVCMVARIVIARRLAKINRGSEM